MAYLRSRNLDCEYRSRRSPHYDHRLREESRAPYEHRLPPRRSMDDYDRRSQDRKSFSRPMEPQDNYRSFRTEFNDPGYRTPEYSRRVLGNESLRDYRYVSSDTRSLQSLSYAVAEPEDGEIQSGASPRLPPQDIPSRASKYSDSRTNNRGSYGSQASYEDSSGHRKSSGAFVSHSTRSSAQVLAPYERRENFSYQEFDRYGPGASPASSDYRFSRESRFRLEDPSLSSPQSPYKPSGRSFVEPYRSDYRGNTEKSYRQESTEPPALDRRPSGIVHSAGRGPPYRASCKSAPPAPPGMDCSNYDFSLSSVILGPCVPSALEQMTRFPAKSALFEALSAHSKSDTPNTFTTPSAGQSVNLSQVVSRVDSIESHVMPPMNHSTASDSSSLESKLPSIPSHLKLYDHTSAVLPADQTSLGVQPESIAAVSKPSLSSFGLGLKIRRASDAGINKSPTAKLLVSTSSAQETSSVPSHSAEVSVVGPPPSLPAKFEILSEIEKVDRDISNIELRMSELNAQIADLTVATDKPPLHDLTSQEQDEKVSGPMKVIMQNRKKTASLLKSFAVLGPPSSLKYEELPCFQQSLESQLRTQLKVARMLMKRKLDLANTEDELGTRWMSIRKRWVGEIGSDFYKNPGVYHVKHETNCAHLPDQILLKDDLRLLDFLDNNRLVEDAKEEDRQIKANNPWTDEEKEIFTCRFMKHPKNFRRIQSHLPRKSYFDCVSYYYLMKHTLNLLKVTAVRRNSQLGIEGDVPAPLRNKRPRQDSRQEEMDGLGSTKRPFLCEPSVKSSKEGKRLEGEIKISGRRKPGRPPKVPVSVTGETGGKPSSAISQRHLSSAPVLSPSLQPQTPFQQSPKILSQSPQVEASPESSRSSSLTPRSHAIYPPPLSLQSSDSSLEFSSVPLDQAAFSNASLAYQYQQMYIMTIRNLLQQGYPQETVVEIANRALGFQTPKSSQSFSFPFPAARNQPYGVYSVPYSLTQRQADSQVIQPAPRTATGSLSADMFSNRVSKPDQRFSYETNRISAFSAPSVEPLKVEQGLPKQQDHLTQVPTSVKEVMDVDPRSGDRLRKERISGQPTDAADQADNREKTSSSVLRTSATETREHDLANSIAEAPN